MNTAKGAVEDRTGLVANTVIMARKVFENVIMSTEFKEWTTYTNSVVLETLEAQRRLLAMYFGVNQVLIGNAVYDSANKGQSFTSAQIWDDEYCLVCVCASNPNDLREPCIGRTFLWTTDSPSNMVVEEYREEQTRSNVYRCRQSTDEVMVFAGAGYLLSNITT